MFRTVIFGDTNIKNVSNSSGVSYWLIELVLELAQLFSAIGY